MKKLSCTLVFLILLLISSAIVTAQDNYIDSLKNVLLTQKEDTNKINTLNYLYNYHYWTDRDYDNAMQYARAALALAIKINYKPGIADGYLNLGKAYGAKKDKFNESKYFNKALALYVEAGNKQNIIDCYDNMANQYMLETDFGKAVECRYDAQKIIEQTGDKKMIADGFHFIANALNYSPDNSEEVIRNSLAALKLYKELNNKSGIGECFYIIGNAYSNQRKYTEALDKFAEALQIFKDLGIPTEIEVINEQIASVYEKQGDSAYYRQNKTEAAYKYSKAEKSEFNALSISRNEYPLNMAACFSGLGQIDIKLGKLNQAKKYLDSSQLFYKPYAVYLSISRNYYNLSKIDSIQGNYKDAYKNYTLFHIYSDSVKTEENTKATVQAQMKYDYDNKQAIAKAEQDKKDAEAKRIKTQQYFAIAGLGVVVLAVVVITFIQYRNNKHKQKANVALESAFTNLKSTQAQLIQSEKMASLGELTAGIAHEIQNPLNFVNNFSEVNKELVDELQTELQSGNTEEAIAISNDIKDNEEKINHHGKRADAIVKGMLQHSRTSTGQKELTDVNALADEYLRLSYHGMRAKDKSFNADFKTDFDNAIEKINIIPQDIGRVLLNLYNNAFYAVTEKRKFQPDTYQPKVTVSTKKINNKIELTVTDNGNGIPQNIVDKIFQPFFTTKPTGEGTGLGLSLSYDIIKAHGGEIKVETKEGEGSMFTIQLPIV